MKKMAKRAYRSKKFIRAHFDTVATEFTDKFAILIGIERLGGYTDQHGVYMPPAFSLHVDGLCYRVESLSHAVAFLSGVVAGFEFSASGTGRGFVTRSELERVVKEVIQKEKGIK
jgi:hypothetical protein